MEQILNYIRPELLILVPVLYLAGTAFKKSELVKDKHIPVLLGILGTALALLYILSADAKESDTTMMIFSAVTQGVLCAGASVYANQLVKQSGKEE